ncbi:TIGR03620 family F420-dependent LLM class oxidoreductase [Nocardia sp. NPDC059239]|uniref:TIGR03620 family F420-dependent LLM class oxidoreductase n=1 Tax=unclassified Nocardia TaxID=2637762 RepID=UPI0036890AF0
MIPLGRYGAWLHPVYDDARRIGYAVEAEALGYGAVWLGLGQRDESELRLVEQVLDATGHVIVATAIVNMWTNDPTTLAKSCDRLEARHPGRFLLGIGPGHPETVTGYRSPYQRMESFLDALDAEGHPRDRRVLAALGPRTLRLAAARAAGTHPYLTVPGHTQQARRLLGPGPLLAPEHTVVVDTDPAEARRRGRAFVSNPYLRLSNYVNNLLRQGYDEPDVAGDGSDRLIDDLILHGTPETIATGLAGHFAAGADHVAIQVLPGEGEGPMPGLRTLAGQLIS